MNAAQPNRTSFNKPAHSYSKRPFQRTSAVRSQYRAPWVPSLNRNFPSVNRKFSNVSRNVSTVNRKFLTANRKFPIGSIKFSTANMGKKGNAVKASACWIWKPSQNTTNKECILLGRNFKLSDDDNVLLRTPRQHNMYSIDLSNIVPHKDLTCLVAKASTNECMLWHMRLGHLNFKTMNRLVRHNLVRGLPSKCFENDHSCTACLKGKQNKASCKSKLVKSVTKPLHTLHMDLFGPSSKEIKREFSNARTPQQKGVAERRNRTLIEAARTMLADVKLPVTFWAEAVNTACYIQNKGSLRQKGDEGYFIGYSMSSKAFRVFNKRTKRIEENLHVDFLENKAIKKGAGPNWLLDIDYLTNSMNYVPVVVTCTNSTNFLGTKDAASQEVKKDVSSLRYIALSNWVRDALLESSSSKPQDDCSTDAPESSGNSNPTATLTNPPADQLETLTTPSIDNILTLTNRFEDILGVTTNSVDSDGVEANVRNIETTITASPIPTLRIHKDHPKSQIIRPVDTPIQTRNKSKEVGEQSFIAIIHQKTDPALLQCCLFSCFLSQVEQVRPIGTKCVLKNKKDERGIVIRNKVRLVAQGLTQEEGIDYDDVFAPVARIKAIRLFLAYASFMGFIVYQMDVKSVFLYETIDKEVEFKALMHKNFQMSAMGELNFFFGLQVLQNKDVIFLSQDKYVGDILKKSGYSDVRSSNTPMDKENPCGKDRTGKDVDLHLYGSMIGSLMHLTTSRLDIMFTVCAYARHQVTPKECHLHAVKRMFRYLKGHPKLGIWYPKESPFDLVAYSDSDYGGATQDRKSTTRGCQFLGRRLISWQCKKQTIVAASTTEAEYVTAARTSKYWGVLKILMISLRLIPLVSKVDAGTISTNLLGINDATRQEVKKDASSLRYIALPNWAHDAILEFSLSKPQDHCSTEVPKGSGNPNPIASISNPPANQMEKLTVETPIPTVSSPVPTAYSTDSQEPSSDARLISKKVANQEETPSLDNILSLTNRFEDILGVTTNSDESNGVEADISNMETAITASPTPTLRIHKDHPKSQIIGPLDTPIQTRNKSKEVEEQSFIATMHQKTDPALL
nr:putative ribonuclease H-like domain-containing protein [Tanacetum cinerariifolium]